NAEKARRGESASRSSGPHPPTPLSGADRGGGGGGLLSAPRAGYTQTIPVCREAPMNRFALSPAALLLPSLAPAAKTQTYDSPKAVFTAAVAASKKKQWRIFFNCLDKKSHDRLAIQALAASFQLRKGDEDDKKIQEAIKAFDNLTRKHGLKKEDLEKIEDFL